MMLPIRIPPAEDLHSVITILCMQMCGLSPLSFPALRQAFIRMGTRFLAAENALSMLADALQLLLCGIPLRRTPPRQIPLCSRSDTEQPLRTCCSGSLWLKPKIQHEASATDFQSSRFTQSSLQGCRMCMPRAEQTFEIAMSDSPHFLQNVHAWSRAEFSSCGCC